MLWTDNLMIPKAAAHKGTAELMINYYYDPVVSAVLTAGVDYISPVKGAEELMIAGRPGRREQRARHPAARLGRAACTSSAPCPRRTSCTSTSSSRR